MRNFTVQCCIIAKGTTCASLVQCTFWWWTWWNDAAILLCYPLLTVLLYRYVMKWMRLGITVRCYKLCVGSDPIRHKHQSYTSVSVANSSIEWFSTESVMKDPMIVKNSTGKLKHTLFIWMSFVCNAQFIIMKANVASMSNTFSSDFQICCRVVAFQQECLFQRWMHESTRNKVIVLRGS